MLCGMVGCNLLAVPNAALTAATLLQGPSLVPWEMPISALLKSHGSAVGQLRRPGLVWEGLFSL